MEIINITEYRTKYPSDSRYTDDCVTTSINMSFDTIDGKYCAGQISSRWELEEANGGFSDKQKSYIKNAFLIQTRWYLQTGLNYPAGTYQRTNGSQSLNLTISKRDEIYEDVIYWLELAGLTKTLNGGKVLKGCNSNCSDSACDMSKYITQEIADAKYINTQYTNSEGEKVKNKIPYFNDNSIVSYISPSDIVNIAESTLKTLENGILENKKDIIIAKNDIATLKDSLNSVATDLNELDREVLKNTTNISSLQTQEKETLAKISENTKNIASHDTKISDLEKKVDSYDTQTIVDLNNRVSNCEAKINTLQTNLDNIYNYSILWYNDNTTSNFAEQTISIPELANYKQIMVVFGRSITDTSDNIQVKVDILPTQYDKFEKYIMTYGAAVLFGSTQNDNLHRDFRIYTNDETQLPNKIQIWDCRNLDETVRNDCLIPIYIIGRFKRS